MISTFSCNTLSNSLFFSIELMFSFQLSLLSKTSPKYFMGTCRAPQLELSPKRFTMAARALFSASKQTHFIQFVCDSEWVTVALHSFFSFSFFFFFLSSIFTEVVTALFGCYMAGATSEVTLCSWLDVEIQWLTKHRLWVFYNPQCFLIMTSPLSCFEARTVARK